MSELEECPWLGRIRGVDDRLADARTVGRHRGVLGGDGGREG